MLFHLLKALTIGLVATVLLSACAQIERTPALAQRDDDGYCRANAGEQGSKAYSECLKARDAQGARSVSMDKAHLRNSEQMLLGR